MLTTAGKSDSVFAGHMPYTYFQYDPNTAGSQYTNVGPILLLPGNKILQAGSTQNYYTWLSRNKYTGFGVGIAEAGGAVDFSIYPNPAYDHAVINYPAYGNEVMNLRVFDQTGKTVFEKALSNRNTSYQMGLSGWEAGIYVVELRSGNRVSAKKLVVIR